MSRKGITPVIAVVLLLLITVGAVASAWSLYQNITSDRGQLENLAERRKAENTEIATQYVYRSDDNYINVSLRNNGGEAVNLSKDVDLFVSPPSTSEYLSSNLLKSNFDIGNPDKSSCFGGEGRVLITSGSNRNLQCNTSIEFPNAGESVRFRLKYSNVQGYSWEFRCVPSYSGSIRCD
ncbi:MAG: type IV pilin N-terminal domain-containing protein [Candidatus Nanohaloarchaea archaeon]